MKLLILSDIHGSSYYANMIPEIFKREKADKLVLLGDLYYHGPRNPLTNEYNPMEVCNILNSMKENVIAIKGNCDAEVDEMISEFKFSDNVEYILGDKKIFFTHGHKYNIDNIPEGDIDILIYGHFHTGFIKHFDKYIVANAGSMSLPKNETPNSYLVIDENELILKKLDGEVIQSEKLS